MKTPNTYGRINATDRQFGGAKVELTPPARITNATTREPFTGIPWNIRTNGEEHKQYKSLGVGV